jgi:hypothetical protein
LPRQGACCALNSIINGSGTGSNRAEQQGGRGVGSGVSAGWCGSPVSPWRAQQCGLAMTSTAAVGPCVGHDTCSQLCLHPYPHRTLVSVTVFLYTGSWPTPAARPAHAHCTHTHTHLTPARLTLFLWGPQNQLDAAGDPVT